MRAVIAGSDPRGAALSKRARQRLDELRREHAWVHADGTTLIRDAKGRVRWWTFAGLLANVWLGAALEPLRTEVTSRDNLAVAFDSPVQLHALRQAIAQVDLDVVSLRDAIVPEAIEGLKFADCLPYDMALRVVTARLDDRPNAAITLDEPLHGVVLTS